MSELFKAQRRLGNGAATVELEDAFAAIAFRQLDMQDSEKLVSMYQFEPKEKRTAKFALSFEKFRLLSKLVHLSIATPDGERPLTPEEIALATADLGTTAKLTGKVVRKRIGMPDDPRFTSIKPGDDAQDIAAGTCKASRHSTGELEAVAHAMNTRPRKKLRWKTPAAVLDLFLTLQYQPSVATTG